MTDLHDISDQRGITAPDGTTKARIERAAVTLFADRGVDAVTTREISAASGISEGALYRHFRSKTELAETVFFSIHQMLADAVKAAAQTSDNIDEQATAIVERYCELADEDWSLFAYHLMATHRFLPNNTGRNPTDDNPVSQAERIIQSAVERGTLAPCNANLKAAMALGVVLQTALHKFYGRLEGPINQYKTEITAGVLAVIRS